MLIKKLVECVSKGGNLLLNVGPDAKGNIPPQSLEILGEIGAWMKRNGESIYGCGKAGMESRTTAASPVRATSSITTCSRARWGPCP